jgi:hypothetical protein
LLTDNRLARKNNWEQTLKLSGEEKEGFKTFKPRFDGSMCVLCNLTFNRCNLQSKLVRFLVANTSK